MIASEIATLTYENLSDGVYEYSINDSLDNFKNNPIFDNLLPGINKVYFYDLNGKLLTGLDP